MSKQVYVRYRFKAEVNITKIQTMHYLVQPPDFFFEGERHDFWEMLYVDKGEYIVTADQTCHHLKRGDIIFHMPNEFHTNRCTGVSSANIFVTSFECRSAVMRFLERQIFALTEKSRDLLSKIIKQREEVFVLSSTSNQDFRFKLRPDAPIGSEHLLKLYMEQFLILLLQEMVFNNRDTQFFPSRESFGAHITEQIIKILREHLYSNISLESICRKVNYSKSYLCPLFKSVIGSGIMQYYNMLKVKEAGRLIHETRKSVREVSDLLQFNNPQYFSRTFKRIMHITPTEYRQSVRW